MPIRVEIEGKGMVAEFPDGTDPSIIDAAVKRDYFGGKEIPTPEPFPISLVEGASPWEVGQVPPVKETIRAMSPYARPIVEGAGLIGGGIVGAPFGPAGAVGGAGLGYAGAKSIMDAIDELTGAKPSPSLVERAYGGAKDVMTGATMEMGGQILGKGIDVAGKALAESKLAQRLYASAIKFPLSKKWKKVRSPEDISMIEQATRKGIQEEIPPSLYGLEKVKTGKTAAGKEIEAGVDSAVGTASTDEIVTNGLAQAVKQAKSADAPLKEAKAIEDFAEAFKAGRAGELTPKEMQEIKVWLHARANYDKVSGKADALLETMRKGVAHELRIKLESMNPALRGANQSYADWKVLEEALETSLPRRNNREMVDLGTKILLRKESWPLAIMNQTIGHPQVKAQIAFMVSKAGNIPAKAIGRAVSTAPIAFQRPVDPITEAYGGAP